MDRLISILVSIVVTVLQAALAAICVVLLGGAWRCIRGKKPMSALLDESRNVADYWTGTKFPPPPASPVAP